MVKFATAKVGMKVCSKVDPETPLEILCLSAGDKIQLQGFDPKYTIQPSWWIFSDEFDRAGYTEYVEPEG